MGERLLSLSRTPALDGGLEIADSNRHASPTPFDNYTTAPPVSSSPHVKPQLGHGYAIFSTDLGSRAPRAPEDTKLVRCIARSDMVIDVVVGAGNLLRKYPYQYLNIFPHQGWQVCNLWDGYDIQIEGENYFKEVLGFIERDNVVRSQNFASEWAHKYPERQCLIGGEMTGLYDKSNPLSIVDKLFVNGESRDYPPIFLWTVAHFLRASMIAVTGITIPLKEAVKTSKRPIADHEDSVVHTNVEASVPVNATTLVPVGTDTTVEVSTPVVKLAKTASNTRPSPAWLQGPQSPRIPDGTQAHVHITPPVGHLGVASYAEPTGDMLPTLFTHQTGVPHMAHPGMQNPGMRSGRSASGSQNQNLSSNPYTEKLTRIPSGYDARQHAGHMPMPQPPRFNQAQVLMNHPMSNVPPGILPFGYEQVPVGPGIVPSQSHPVGVVHPSYVAPHTMHGNPVAHGYARQPPNAQFLPFATPMGDLTNTQYGGPPVMHVHNMDVRRPQDRRFSRQHANSNALYDPYEGSDPAFRNSGYPSSRKYNQHGLQNPNIRPRKPSYPDSRPYHSQHANGRPHAGGPYPPGPKPFSEDDRAITQDREAGCYVDWIGPQNETVNELFVKDLPEDVQDTELEALFQDRLGVKPTSVNVRFSPHFPQQTQARRHAFVGFSSTMTAKQALVIHSPTIRGLPVSITVPKRFFQKTLDVSPRDMLEAGPSAYSRFTSNPNNREARNRYSSLHEGGRPPVSTNVTKEKLSYSPQDARSQLNKKKKGKQTQQAQPASGSPEIAKVKPDKIHESLTEKSSAAPARVVKTGALKSSAEGGGPESVTDVVPKTTHIASTRTDELLASEAAFPIVAKGNGAENHDAQFTALKLGADSPASETAFDGTSQAQPKHASPDPRESVEPGAYKLPKEDDQIQDADEEIVAKPGPSRSNDREEPVSDDELKNEASFHSAAESQSDLDPKSDHKTGSDIKNHGIIISVPKAGATTSIPTYCPPAPAADTYGEYIVVSSDLVSTSEMNEPPKTEGKLAEMPLADSNATMVSSDTQQQEKVPVSTTINVGQTKKSGPQQTEPLGPYPSRAQREAQAKKEREQKKKAQKKEKELAQKAKAEKAAAKKAQAEHMMTVKTSSTDTKTEVEAESAGTEFQDIEKEYSSIKKSASSSTSHEVVKDISDKAGSRKGETAVTSIAKDTAPNEVKSKDHGKQVNGNSILNKTGSVTIKDAKTISQENAQKDSQKPSQKVSRADATSPAAQSSKQLEYGENSSGVPKSSPAITSVVAPTPSGKKKNKKKKKSSILTEGQGESSRSAPKWPSLEFRPRTSNPVWMGPIDMENDIQNYEAIMDKACGGPDDSDFSWSDLPTMEDFPGLDQDEAQAKPVEEGELRVTFDTKDAEGIKTYARTLLPKIKKLQPNMAAEIMARIINNTTVTELAKLATDNSALNAKVDEIVLFHQDHEATASKGPQPVAYESSVVGQSETVDKGIAILETQIVDKKEEMEAVDAKLVAYEEQLEKHSSALEISNASDGRIATLETQLAATKAEIAAAQVNIALFEEQRASRTIEQIPSDIVSSGPQLSKKKKSNKNKNRKKKKAAENSEVSQSGEVFGNINSADSTPSKDEAASVDTKEPFMHQMREVDSIIMQGHDGAADTNAPVRLRGGACSLTDEPIFMRNMEAYFREAHPECKSKGKEVLRRELQ